MFIVIGNPLGFHVIDQLPTCAKINSDYFTTNIVVPLEQKIFPDGRKLNIKRLTIRLDSCSIHTSRATEIYATEHNVIRLKHSPYSPDLAPSDFDFFPITKERLTDI
jgi:hypothetical protein